MKLAIADNNDAINNVNRTTICQDQCDHEEGVIHIFKASYRACAFRCLQSTMEDGCGCRVVPGSRHWCVIGNVFNLRYESHAQNSYTAVAPKTIILLKGFGVGMELTILLDIHADPHFLLLRFRSILNHQGA